MWGGVVFFSHTPLCCAHCTVGAVSLLQEFCSAFYFVDDINPTESIKKEHAEHFKAEAAVPKVSLFLFGLVEVLFGLN